jgi:nicotinamide-nucleotide amidase
MHKAMDEALGESVVVIISGGLGPTSDDLTRNVVSEVCHRDLEFSQSSWERIESFLAAKGVTANPANRCQCYFPKGALVLENEWGTADAFVTEVDNSERFIIALPGVPKELKSIYVKHVQPWLRGRFPNAQEAQSTVLKCFGLSESYIGKTVEECSLPEEVEVAYRASFPEVSVSLRSSDIGFCELEQYSKKVSQALGEDNIFARSADASMASVVGEHLVDKKSTLSLAESCTGGLISHLLVSVPGASQFLRGSVVAYSNEVKEQVLGVQARTIKDHGAVSAETAKEMAKCIRALTGADIGVSVTGIAGPDGGSAEKPVGTVFFGVDTSSGSNAVAFNYVNDRNSFRYYCAYLALNLVRRLLLGLDLNYRCES